MPGKHLSFNVKTELVIAKSEIKLKFNISLFIKPTMVNVLPDDMILKQE